MLRRRPRGLPGRLRRRDRRGLAGGRRPRSASPPAPPCPRSWSSGVLEWLAAARLRGRGDRQGGRGVHHVLAAQGAAPRPARGGRGADRGATGYRRTEVTVSAPRRNVEAMQLFGVDIGGSGIKGAPVDLDSGDLAQERHKVLTPHPATPDAVADGVQRGRRPLRLDGPGRASPSPAWSTGRRRPVRRPTSTRAGSALDAARRCSASGWRPAGDGAQRRGRGGHRRDDLRRGPRPQGHGHPAHPRHRHRQRRLRRRRACAQHRAGPPGAARPRRGEARLHQGQGGRGPELGALGAPACRSTSPTWRCCSRPSCSSSAAGSAARPTSSCRCIEGIRAEIVPAAAAEQRGDRGRGDGAQPRTAPDAARAERPAVRPAGGPRRPGVGDAVCGRQRRRSRAPRDHLPRGQRSARRPASRRTASPPGWPAR